MITIGYSTRKSNPVFQEYLKKSAGHPKIQVIEKVNNGDRSLSMVYNEIISESENEIVVLCHDEIYFETSNWAKKLIKHFEKTDYGVLGVAGTTNMDVSGMWWTDSTKMVGIVNHESGGKKWESRYANGIPNSIQEVCLVDGLFLAINTKKIKNNFDESFDGFHFYDVSFCTENFLQGVKIGVIYDIRITHKSIGMTNQQWDENRKKYVEKYESKLPFQVNPSIDYQFIKYDEPKNSYNLIVQTSTEENTINFLQSIEKLSVYNNLQISLISTDSNLENIKKFEKINIKVFEGFFDSLNKNLSILKWDDEFLKNKKDLVFFCSDETIIKNNVFGSMSEIYKKEKNIFGCIYPSVLNKNSTIFSNGLDIVQNKEQKINLILKAQSSYYNLFNGYYNNFFGNVSDFFATTIQNLKTIDWFDINFETNIFNLDFAMKMNLKKHKIFIDTNSVVSFDYELKKDKIDEELRRLLNQILSVPQIKNNIKIIK